jgi:glutamate/tyrosine decarboxylase-like PLP-dependent enzyme
MMNVPLVCSAFFTKHIGLLENTVSTDRAGYIFHEHDLMDYDLGRLSLQCGRRVDVLKLWLAWNYFGDIGWNNQINYLFETANKVKEHIKNQNELELIVEPKSLNILFRVKTAEDLDSDKFNLAIREKMRLDGTSMCNYTRVNNMLVFRLIIINPEKTFDDYLNFFANLRLAKEQIENSIIYA